MMTAVLDLRKFPHARQFLAQLISHLLTHCSRPVTRAFLVPPPPPDGDPSPPVELAGRRWPPLSREERPWLWPSPRYGLASAMASPPRAPLRPPLLGRKGRGGASTIVDWTEPAFLPPLHRSFPPACSAGWHVFFPLAKVHLVFTTLRSKLALFFFLRIRKVGVSEISRARGGGGQSRGPLPVTPRRTRRSCCTSPSRCRTSSGSAPSSLPPSARPVAHRRDAPAGLPPSRPAVDPPSGHSRQSRRIPIWNPIITSCCACIATNTPTPEQSNPFLSDLLPGCKSLVIREDAFMIMTQNTKSHSVGWDRRNSPKFWNSTKGLISVL